MINFLLFMVLCLLCDISESEECTPCGRSDQWSNINQNRQERIIGGGEPPRNAFPWIVRIQEGCASNFKIQRRKVMF